VAKLDGKVAVITGASSGIGEATAEALAAEGASVVVAARRKDRLSELVVRNNGNGGKAVSVECDVTDEEAALDLIRHAKDELGREDILVNNAGVMLLSKIGKGLSDQWRQMFDVTRRFRGTKPRELRFHARLSANGAQQLEIAGA
jgi:NADP-dependent 3-hydroxy acid dehydrogenase YdfG